MLKGPRKLQSSLPAQIALRDEICQQDFALGDEIYDKRYHYLNHLNIQKVLTHSNQPLGAQNRPPDIPRCVSELEQHEEMSGFGRDRVGGFVLANPSDLTEPLGDEICVKDLAIWVSKMRFCGKEIAQNRSRG